ncbi:hypothetical protein GCM10009119_05910 [Algoriphagus jejuensis]|uniref:DUF4381 domain-containing protein n=1 Tax=Algoriphagus jejuensis TaxID=419934 RepID=A0ABN1MW32_9BACT
MIHLQDSIAAQADTTANPLAQFEMGKLYEPDAVKFSFETVGWPILGGLILLGLLVAAFFWYRHYRRNAYRREALKSLDSIGQGETMEIFVVLKRTAIHAFGREKVGRLSGAEWLKFLESSGKNVKMLGRDKQIQLAIYQNEALPSEARQAIISNAKQWVKTHAVKL